MSKITELTPELEAVLRIAARQNFWCFCCLWDWDFFRVKRRFLKEVAFLFQEVADAYAEGRSMTVSISMPPRAGKSYITSLFAAWWLGTHPKLSVMRNTCTASLYQEFSYVTRGIVQDQRFKNVFPEIRLKKDKQNLDGWSLETSKQVGYFGGGVGTNIIGKGANIAITDDLYSGMTDALSDAITTRTDLWKSSEHNSRMEKNCPEIFIGTRWTKRDVIGKAIESGKIEKSVIIPALIDGKTFCDDVKSTEEYLAIRQEEGEDSMTWQSEYMQQPIEAKGLLLPESELQFDDFSKINPDGFLYRFAVGDPADNGGDKYAMPFCYVRFSGAVPQVYVTDAICNGYGIEYNSEMIIKRCTELFIDDVYIESNGVGLASIVLIKNRLHKNTTLKPFNSSENKEVRIMSHYEFIKRYFVFDKDYKQKPEYRQFMQDLTSYVKGGQNSHKADAIDCLATAAQVIKAKYRKSLY